MLILRNIGVILTFVVLASGCASVLNTDLQAVYISTKCKEKVFQAYCTASTHNNKFNIITPTTILVPRAPSSLMVICESSISEKYGAVAQAFPSPAFIANIGLGGLVGATLDIANNKAWAYPSSINIEIPWCQSIKK